MDRAAESTGTFQLTASPDTTLVFRADVRVTAHGSSVTLASAYRSFALHGVPLSIQKALARLGDSPVPLGDLFEPLTQDERGQLEGVLRRCSRLLARCVMATGARELMRVEPTADHAHYSVGKLMHECPIRLSRFALFRRRAGVLALESPLTKHRAELRHSGARTIITGLTGATTAAEVSRESSELLGLSPSEVYELLSNLVGAGFAEVGHWEAGMAIFDADTDCALRQWEFHDLLFHSRSRQGRYDDPSGGVSEVSDEIDLPPAVKQPPQGPTISLPVPSCDEINASDPSLTSALESRSSIRSFGRDPLSVRQLGEFLYRVGRIRRRDPTLDGAYQVAERPYPGGGGLYELELYVTVQRCGGCPAGIYYYDPLRHMLVLINSDDDDRAAMLGVAASAMGRDYQPDVLLTISARFQRISWKYRSIAYALILRNAGVVYQTMYLVATAMDIARCGIGGGDSDLASRVLKLDYLRESSVGDFVIGSRPCAS